VKRSGSPSQQPLIVSATFITQPASISKPTAERTLALSAWSIATWYYGTTIRTYLVRILPPPLRNHMFSLGKRGFGDDSGDSQDDSLKRFWGPRQRTRRRSTCRHGHAWIGTESQSNWPNMRKTLGKPGFLSGENRTRTFECFPNGLGKFERCLKRRSRLLHGRD
jgi:hypothetical protein